MNAEYGIYRQNGYVVWLCADCLDIRRHLHDCDARFPDEDDKVHPRAVHLPPIECHDCDDEKALETEDHGP